MFRPFFCLTVCLFVSLVCLSQTDTTTRILKGAEAAEFFNKLGFDSAYLLRQTSYRACNCIDSVDRAEDDNKLKREAIIKCIDNQVQSYELSIKILPSINGSDKNVIELSPKNSSQYKRRYYEIETWLKDSCSALTKALSSNNDEREKSYSKNPDALKAYSKGLKFLNNEQYEEGIEWFAKAVKIDEEFVFAWDNLGLCYRRTGKLKKAESAYKSSLKVDAGGKTALQNLAVVYQFQNKIDDAIAAYINMSNYYPDDPEVFYGLGLMYKEKHDLEKALDNICKAYNLYVEQKSAYRVDAEKLINLIYSEMKKENKQATFQKILTDNNIETN